MRKQWLVALLLCVAMLVGGLVAEAETQVFVPLHVSEIPSLPEEPQAPIFSNLREENGYYTVDVDWNGAFYELVNEADAVWMTASDISVEFTYDSKTSSFTSNATISVPVTEWTQFAFYGENKSMWHESGISYFVNINYDPSTLNHVRTDLDIWRDQDEQLSFAWINGQLMQWYNWSNKCHSINFDSNGNISQYWYTVDDLSYPVGYTADGVLTQCPVVVDGTLYRYFYYVETGKERWRDANDQPVAAPEGYDRAKLYELYPPLIGSIPEPTTAPTAAPTDTPAPDETPSATPDATATPAPTSEVTPEPTPAPTPEPTPEPTPTPTPIDATWYGHNTLGLIGLPLRDLYPNLTDKWYNIVPIDLTRQGQQSYPLVASNLFYMGTATVDIRGDSVTVTYQTPGTQWTAFIEVEDECLAWFTNPADITADFLANPTATAAFGDSVSISGDLKGQEVALLFICNHVTYRQPCFGDTGYLTRYWPNLQEWKDYRQALSVLMQRLPE